MSSTITFYDIPGHAAKDIAWSPNTWKVRYALNIKGLPYKTSWVEYPDIEALAKRIGAKPTAHHPTLGPYYSLPIIHDPSTNSVVADSFHIVQYLDKTYPDTPVLIPKGTAGLQYMFANICFEKVGLHTYYYMNYKTMMLLPLRSQVYWRRTREIAFGQSIEEIAPEGSAKKDEHWKNTIEGLTALDKWLSVEQGPFIMGDKPTFADIVSASQLTLVKRILGEDSKEWAEILTVNEGRWKRTMDVLEKWETVDEEGLKYEVPA